MGCVYVQYFDEIRYDLPEMHLNWTVSRLLNLYFDWILYKSIEDATM